MLAKPTSSRRLASGDHVIDVVRARVWFDNTDWRWIVFCSSGSFKRGKGSDPGHATAQACKISDRIPPLLRDWDKLRDGSYEWEYTNQLTTTS